MDQETARIKLEGLGVQIKDLDNEINYLLIVAIMQGTEEEIKNDHEKLYIKKLNMLHKYVQLHKIVYPEKSMGNIFSSKDEK